MEFFTELFNKRLHPGDKLSAGFSFCGLFGGGKAYFLRELADFTNEKMIVVAKSELSARKLYDDLSFLMGDDSVINIEPAEYMLYDAMPSKNSSAVTRTASLVKLLRGEYSVCIISPATLLERLPEEKILLENILKLEKDEEYDLIGISDRLSSMGYARMAKAEEEGQFSLRGDILDVFPFGAEMPIRAEFFGETLDSLRTFDPLTQHTSEEIRETEIYPERETYVFGKKAAEKVKNAIIASADICINKDAKRRAMSDAERVVTDKIFRGSDRYIYFATGEGKTVFDYAGDVKTIVEEKNEISETVKSIFEDHVRICDSIGESGGILPETYRIYRNPDDVFYGLEERKGFEITQFGIESPKCTEIKQEEITNISDGKHTEAEYLAAELKMGKSIIYYTDSEGRAGRLAEMISENGGTASLRSENLAKGVIVLEKGGLSSSFSFPEYGLSVITENALAGKKIKKAKKSSKKSSDKMLAFSDLSVGDIVVHEVHGIGRYEGICSMTADGVRGDYIKIAYRDNGVIYVPAHRLSEIKKYIGNDNSVPALNKLGTKEWENMKARVKASLRIYAEELVALYAKRSCLKGFAFSEDTPWQKEFEDEFPFEETNDQLRCIEEIKNDMQLERPMDRLLCGDVGYGKTEVAIRAAFKAVCDGKQVIVLVPTTVLAMQHFKTFTERFKNYPVKVACISRMVSEKNKKSILEDAKKGRIDILIGTHSIIMRNVNFKDPGLFIIDEEQRFGVKQKEKIKEMYPSIDILTLSATPIPRTLHMSLSGIRDISILEDPPQNRTPVKTYVAEWNPTMVKNAIYREMGRKGQIFYLHNNVDTIESKMNELKELVPEARICIGNGKMNEKELEDVLNDFIDGKYDILLCTTIIESGVDMPNVNTVIVENGEKFGLSQLYQIRGRVGRSERTAYAYITYPGGREITEVAEKRLRTIRENTDFGAGFKIAMKDLEIRGAGSVLGERQHGQIAVVGYEMYCRLLNEVVEETKTGEAAEAIKKSANVDLKAAAYISEDYVKDEESRVGIYRQIASIESDEDIENLTDNIEDRYGKVTKEIAMLMQISYIRYLAEQNYIFSVQRKGDYVFLMFEDNVPANIFSQMGNNAAQKFGKKVSVGVGKSPYVAINVFTAGKEDSVNVTVANVKAVLKYNE